ncbi:hypothetical protein MLD38_031889 [Melastoma candidum]|uniref:Uncharacterized protein n=1 Tax=Melastoma candidum TaxID=119954 RepID=A0ACB9MS75_9MYRT|nr:hypothetical protein MLD38_031889 [Melastoma candidum]
MSSIPLFLDSLLLEGRPELGDRSDGVDVGWEEIDGCVDERELMSVIFDVDEGDPGGDDDGYGLDVMDPGWEVVSELGFERASGDETAGSPVFFQDDDDFADFYAVEYEPMFEPENSSLGAQPAWKSALEALDRTTIACTQDEDVLDCPICKDGMNDGEQARKMPCGHIYHSDCIRKWLQIRNTCPVCRFALQ